MHKRLTLSLLCAVPVLLSSCSGGTAAAERAVAEFRERYARGAFTEIYSSADPELKKASPEADVVRLLNTFQRKLGAFKSAKPPASQVFSDTGGKRVALVYESEFENGRVKEKFVWRLNGNAPTLLGYHIDSPAPIVN